MKKIIVYWGLLIISVLLITVSLTVLGNTEIIAPIIIALSVYLMIGSIIKLCKTSKRLSKIFENVFDLLSWLP